MNKKAFSLIEVLLSIALMAIFSGAIFSLFYASSFSVQSKTSQEQALNYAKEGLEIVKNFSYDNYLDLVSGTYVLEKDASSNYSLVAPGSEVLDSFYERQVVISDVYRDENSNIDALGQTLDPLTKKITIQVSWISNGVDSKNVVLQEYITDWEGTTWTQTTQSQFNAGTLSDVEVLQSGMIIPDDGKAELFKTATNLDYFGSANVWSHSNDVFYVNDILYAAVDRFFGGICATDVSDPENPVVLDCENIFGRGQALLVEGNYAYLAKNFFHGLAVIDISDPNNLHEVTTISVGGPAKGIDIQGNYLYLSVANSHNPLVVVNISNPESPFVASTSGGNSSGKGIKVNDRYAYLTNRNDELRIYDINNPNSLVFKSSLGLQGSGYTSAYKDSYLYIATDNSNQGLEVVNVADPLNPLAINTYDIGGEGRGAAISFDILSVAVDRSHAGAAVYDISDPLNLILLKTIDINGKGLGTYATESYFYEAVDTGHQGVAIISIGDFEYELLGDYISQAHDTNDNETLYKSISWVATTPPGTGISFQIRTADTLENLAAANFVGPDGTLNTTYSASYSKITLDPANTGKRFFQWKAYFESDSNSTPSLDEVTINYE